METRGGTEESFGIGDAEPDQVNARIAIKRNGIRFTDRLGVGEFAQGVGGLTHKHCPSKSKRLETAQFLRGQRRTKFQPTSYAHTGYAGRRQTILRRAAAVRMSRSDHI